MKFNKRKLSSVCDFIAGFSFKSSEFGNYKDKVIKITDIKPPYIDADMLIGVDTKNYDKNRLKKYFVTQDDYVMAMTGSVGKISKIKKGEAYINQRVLLFKPKNDLDKDFLYYRLLKKDFYQYIINFIDSNSVQPNISAKTVGKFEFDLPEINFQKKIGQILKSIDDKIENNYAIINKLHEQSIAIIENYFNHTKEQIVLSKLIDFENGYAFQSQTYKQNGKYRIVTIKNVQDRFINSNETAFIEELPLQMKSFCLLSLGDVLLSLTGNVGRVGIVYEKDLLLNQRVAKIKVKNKDLLAFMYFVFCRNDMKVMLETIAKGTAQQNLSTVEALKLSIPFNDETIGTITSQLQTVFSLLINFYIENKKLSTLRDALLPHLMNGEIDVSNVKINT